MIYQDIHIPSNKIWYDIICISYSILSCHLYVVVGEYRKKLNKLGGILTS